MFYLAVMNFLVIYEEKIPPVLLKRCQVPRSNLHIPPALSGKPITVIMGSTGDIYNLVAIFRDRSFIILGVFFSLRSQYVFFTAMFDYLAKAPPTVTPYH